MSLNWQIPPSVAAGMVIAVILKRSKKLRNRLRWHHRIAVHNTFGNGGQAEIPIQRHQRIDKLLAAACARHAMKITKFPPHRGRNGIDNNTLMRGKAFIQEIRQCQIGRPFRHFRSYSNPHKALYGVAPPRRTKAYCLRRRALYRTL